MTGAIIGVVAAVFIIMTIASAAIKIAQKYERGVIFRLGKYTDVRGPGLYVIIPFVERSMKVDLRVVTLDIPSQEAITKDNVTVQVNAKVAVVQTALDPTGTVFVEGELWKARSEGGRIERDEEVEVTKVDGLKLWVRKREKGDQ